MTQFFSSLTHILNHSLQQQPQEPISMTTTIHEGSENNKITQPPHLFIASGIIAIYYHFFHFLIQQQQQQQQDNSLDQITSSIDYLYTSSIVCIRRILLFQFSTHYLMKESLQQQIQIHFMISKTELCISDLFLLLLQVSFFYHFHSIFIFYILHLTVFIALL